jgi:hypothetical protein
MIVPLSLMWAFKPVRHVPKQQGIAELVPAIAQINAWLAEGRRPGA